MTLSEGQNVSSHLAVSILVQFPMARESLNMFIVCLYIQGCKISFVSPHPAPVYCTLPELGISTSSYLILINMEFVFLTCLLHLVPVFSSPAMAPRPSSYLSSTFHKLITNTGASMIPESIQNTAASDNSRLQLVDHNSAPCPMYSSNRGDSIVTANLSPASVTRKVVNSLNPAMKSAVAGTASNGYFAIAQLTQTGSISGTGRLPWPVGERAPFSLRNTSSGATVGSVVSDHTIPTGLLQATGTVTAPAFSFGTGTSPSAPMTEPGDSISDGNSITNTSMTFTSISNSAKAMPSSLFIDYDEDPSNGDATVPPTTTSNSPLAESSGGSSPSPSIWNLNNSNCRDFSYAENGSQQWALVNGDLVVSTFESMFASNALICPECWGGNNNTCTSPDWQCQSGLKDVSQPNISSPARWDTAAAHFAGLGSETDLTCGIMQTECSGAPECTSCNGPGPWAILKSLETMQNLMENIYNAIIQAGVACDAQMTLFSKVFAPVPSIENETLMMTLFAEIFGGILGFIPIVGQISSVAAGVASAVVLSNAFAHAPGPVDTATVLGLIANQTASTYSDFAADLFANGSTSVSSEDGKVNKTIALRDQMKDGALMQQQSNPSGYYTALVPVYQRILFQQLALYTWQNLEHQNTAASEVKGSQHMPFITFDNQPCDQIDSKTPGTLLNKWESLVKDDANMTYDGRCYYLLDAFVMMTEFTDNGQPSGETDSNMCTTMSFPGGTNKALTANAEQFATLSLADFIVPAVRGWQANGNLNGYPTAASNGVLPTDPQAAASVSIPICDYANSEKDPGADCPKLGDKVEGTGCDTYNGANPPGSYNPGDCRVHVTQYKPNSRKDPLNYYEMAITIFDNSNIEVGQATKESAEDALVIVDSALPFQLIVATGADKDTITFWYADQYWDSKTGCGIMGGYSGGSRQGDCSFKCPFPGSGDPPSGSATIAHPLPSSTIAAVAGSVTYQNTFITAAPTATPATPAPPTITYAQGKCEMKIKQYQKHEDGLNEIGDFQIDAVIYDAKKKALQDSGMIPAPAGKPVEVYGLVDTVTLTAGNVDDDPLIVNYQGDTWKTNDKGKCKVSQYEKGKRHLDCPLIC